ncbi:MAG: DNA mismatch repair protein MutS [Flavobacteriales bacterium]|nr:DNA mismatch repair protein MutS [Flavobacteriales bacterium]
MKQYNSIKAKYPDAVLLFRVGDFYETFGQDAVRVSKILNITLTKRANGSASHIELAGFPHHSIDTYLPKLVRSGNRVAICDQLEDPKTVKGIVKRGVTELVTPGVTFNEQVLDGKANNYILAIHESKNNYGLALLDISTGEFLVSEGKKDYLMNVISSYNPSEILIQRKNKELINSDNCTKTLLEDWAFQYDFAYEKLCSHFQVNSLKGFGVDELKNGITASGALFSYLVDDTHHKLLSHITSIQRIQDDNFLWMDSFTIRNLELIYANQRNGTSLYDVLDATQTPMGGRLLRHWISLPSKNKEVIERRLNLVEFLLDNEDIKSLILENLIQIADLERLLGKVASERINPRELGMIRESLRAVERISEVTSKNKKLKKLVGELYNQEELLKLLDSSLQKELPIAISKGNVIAENINAELDSYRDVFYNGKDFLEKMRERLIEETEIPSLKINFNSVFGYYIEVRNTHKDKVPESWIRKQTLVNAERYITEELKNYETQILSAEEKIAQLEFQLYKDLLVRVLGKIAELQHNAKVISRLDVLVCFSEKAIENNYTRPKLSKSPKIVIQDGRHPVIEKLLPVDEPYISNSIEINKNSQQILMITGPNMSGKSALLRQTALMVIMAQIGSYVSAKSLEFGVLDKIFTRVGASDNLSQGESTFMVEMNETANIINNLSENSLILLDEIGRGTSTYDGVSIAWAIAEYLHEYPSKPLTLFATHYHELNEMSSIFKRIKNYNVSIKEVNGTIMFVRKLVEGGSEHSFGIHVAKLAGMPSKLIHRAEEILDTLEKNRTKDSLKNNTKTLVQEDMQLSFFQLDDPVLEQIREELIKVDIDVLTPIEALMKLNHIKKILGK